MNAIPHSGVLVPEAGRHVFRRQRREFLETMLPERRQIVDLVGLLARQVSGFRAIGAKVVKLPRAVLPGRDDLPVARSEGPVPVMEPPERIAIDRGVSREERDQALPGWRRHGPALPGLGPSRAGGLEDRGDEVDDVAGGVPELATPSDPSRPVDDQRGSDATLVDPGLVSAERGIRQARPPRPNAEERRPGAALGARVVTVAPDHDLGAGTVVGEEEDQRVLECVHREELVEDPADLAIHPVDHRRVDRHLAGLEIALSRVEDGPGERSVQLVRAEFLDGVGERIRRAQVAFHRGQPGPPDLQALEPTPALVSQGVPAGEVGVAIAGDVARRRLEREVRSREGDVAQEGLRPVMIRVILLALVGVVVNRGRGVIAAPGIDRGKGLAVLLMEPGREVPVLIVEAIGMVEPILQRRPIDVPLAGVIGTVPLRFQDLGQETGPGRPGALGTALDAGDRVPSDLLSVVSCEQPRPSRASIAAVL